MNWIRRAALALVCAGLLGPAAAQPAASTAQASATLTLAQALPTEVGEALEAPLRDLAQRLLDAPSPENLPLPLAQRFRLQLVAQRYEEALASIEALRAQQGRLAPGQTPMFLQYELYARAKAVQAAQGVDFAEAWRAVFLSRFAALDDRSAWAAEFGFGGSLPRWRAELEAALAKASGRATLPHADALALLRAWQVHASYAAFQPLFQAELQADDARRYAVQREQLRTPDGAELSVRVVRPRQAAALPALLQHTIYAREDWAFGDAKRAAAHGYVGVVSFSRGKGESRGAVQPYRHDGADAHAVIDWIAAQPWSDGRVGMYGGSYSGFTAWAAAKRRPPALKAIAASATAAPGIDVPMEGGVFMNFLFPWPHYVASGPGLDEARYGDSARWAELNRRWWASGRAYRDLPALDGEPNPLFSEWLRHPVYDRYWSTLIPQGTEYAGIDIPVLATTGYFDGAQIGALHYFREHLRHHPQADHRLLIGPFEHFSMQAGVPPVVRGYLTDPVARVDLQALRLQWFDHVLKGGPRPALLAGRVNWQVMGANRWRHGDSLDAMANQRQRLYLVPDPLGGSHRLAGHAEAAARVVLQLSFRDRSGAGWRAPEGVLHRQLDPRAGLVFVGPVLDKAAELAGELRGELHFRVNKRDVDLSLSVYELNAQGEYLELGYWVQRASQAADRRQRRLLKPGALQRLPVRDTRLLGRQLAAGSRLVVTLGVIQQPDTQFNLGSGKDPSDETLADAGAPMRVQWLGSSFLDWPWRAADAD